MRTAEQIRAEIDRLKKLRFYEEMADFMNWGAYNKLTAEIKELEAELAELERMDDTWLMKRFEEVQ